MAVNTKANLTPVKHFKKNRRAIVDWTWFGTFTSQFVSRQKVSATKVLDVIEMERMLVQVAVSSFVDFLEKRILHYFSSIANLYIKSFF